MNQTYTMTRRGTLSPDDITSNQCKDVGHNTYYYTVVVEFQPNILLDEKDFLIDHTDINRSIQESVLMGSCEGLCRIIARQTIQALENKHQKWAKISVTIQPYETVPVEGAFMNLTITP